MIWQFAKALCGLPREAIRIGEEDNLKNRVNKMPISYLVGSYSKTDFYMKAGRRGSSREAITSSESNDEQQARTSPDMENWSAAINPNFKKEFGDYLEANGYVLSNQPAHPGDAMYFFRNEQGVMVSGDSIDFASFKEESPGKPTCCSTYAAFTVISKLDTYGWMMLMHITGIVPLAQFMLGGTSKLRRNWPGWFAAAVC